MTGDEEVTIQLLNNEAIREKKPRFAGDHRIVALFASVARREVATVAMMAAANKMLCPSDDPTHSPSCVNKISTGRFLSVANRIAAAQSGLLRYFQIVGFC